MSIEAMKRLVAAVEAIPEEVEGWMPDALTDALIGAKEAIAEAEQLDNLLFQQPMIDLWQRYCDKKKEIDELKEKLAEAEKQEPVAWAERAAEWLLDLPNTRYDAPYFTNGMFKGDCLELADLLQKLTHPQPKREPPTPLEVKDVLRATGLLTNSQAWDVAEEVMKLLAAHGITSDMKQERVDKTAKQRHEENT